MKNLKNAVEKVVSEMNTWCYEFADIDSMWRYVEEYYDGPITGEELRKELINAGLKKFKIKGTICFAKPSMTRESIIKCLKYEGCF